MSQRSDSEREGEDEPRESGGLGGFLRGLLSGIPWSESAQAVETITLDAPAGARLTIHNANGKTRVVGEDRDDIEVVVTKHARAESTEAAQQLLGQIELLSTEVGKDLELEVDAPARWNRHGGAHLMLRVPRNLEVTAIAVNGRVCLEGLRSSVHARSSNGPVSISDVQGDVEVFTSNAKVHCRCTCGRLKARSSNSKIHLEEHRGSVDASTSNGVIHAVLSELGQGGVVLATSNGRIVLELPDHVDADVDVRVENGVIRSSLEVDTPSGDQRRGRLRGKLGRGGALIKLRTSNGTISLR
jgi:DUF4097 and DUF4098 domain-containing protein YvlB